MKLMIKMKALFALTAFTLLSMVVGVSTCIAAPDKDQVSAAPLVIQTVQLRGEGLRTELAVGASVPATYTSYKTSAPYRLVVDFSQAVPADSLADLKVSGGPVKNVTLKKFDTDAGILTRMEVFLEQDIDPVITPSTAKIGELLITFPGYATQIVPQPEKTEPAPVVQTPLVDEKTVLTTAATETKSESPMMKSSLDAVVPVVTSIAAGAGGIAIQANMAINDYKTFRLNKPERVVIDIPNAKADMVDKLVQLNADGVSTARVGSYPDKVRIVFDAITGTLADATIEKTATGLSVSFAEATSVKKQEVSQQPAVAEKKVETVKLAKHEIAAVAQMVAIDFQVLEDLSRISIKTLGTPAVESPTKSAGSLSLRIKNTQLPRNLQRSLEAREFVSPVLRITPVQVKTKTGNDVLVRVSLKSDAFFELKRESDVVYLDIKHPVDMIKVAADQPTPSGPQNVVAKPAAVKNQLDKVIEQQPLITGKRQYVGRKVTLEFADAEVRKIFQLLSEVSNKNFVLGDEVTGTISLKLVNVPWDQALDIILDTKGLDKREDGNIILIRGKGKFKSLLDEELEIRKATLKTEPLDTGIFEVNYADLGGIVTQFTALKTDRGVITSDLRTNKVIVKDVRTALADMRKLLKDLDVPEKQVMIEARIVEASSDFARSLGVSWGVTNGKGFLNPNNVGAAFGGIASTPGSAALIGSTAGAADITFGTIGSNIKLSMRLNAAAKAGLVRIVSSPKVATLNNKSAKITQGKQIPYISATSDKVETKFVEAALSLEVTPHINNNGTIVLKIDAKNDAPDTTASGSTTPPINKKQATTEMLLRDGETTVIGGIFVDSETEGEEGVPWLMDVPIFGNLFKSKSYAKGKSELLIFITPRILNTPT